MNEIQLPATTDNRYLRFLPLEILYNLNLSPNARLLWIAIWTEFKFYLNSKEINPYRLITCYWKSNDELGALVGVSERQVRRLMVELKDAGYLETLRNYNNASYIIPFHPADKAYNETIAKVIAVKANRIEAKDKHFMRLSDSCYKNTIDEVEVNPLPVSVERNYDDFRAWCEGEFGTSNVLINHESRFVYFEDDLFQYLEANDFENIGAYGLTPVDLTTWESITT
ncbi:hypothetical protein [Enterovibrio baiacu]|uniref:hypothetical protein n=1 Tax=Enterovibrio baiacu TaxID=2491023 RepID=UPI0010127A57|nr:hypothetical protein [Enterovibrio baiacu]MBE1275089.1 hypothetical protein [Enterovibrio baiacu]